MSRHNITMIDFLNSLKSTKHLEHMILMTQHKINNAGKQGYKKTFKVKRRLKFLKMCRNPEKLQTELFKHEERALLDV
jgi:hypothetical protein